jgi:transposase
MNADRTLLSDADWAVLAPLLPGRAGYRGVTAADNRRFVEAVLWVGRTGLPWRDLPPHLGAWHRVFVRFTRWRQAGVWAEVLAALQARGRAVASPRSRQVQLDSTTVRAHQHAAGSRKKRPAGAGA